MFPLLAVLCAVMNPTGIVASGMAVAGVSAILKKFLNDVEDSDKKSYSLREISKEINLPEYTIRRYISTNKLNAESSTDTDNPRKSGYKISKEDLLDFLINNKEELTKSMDKVQRKNVESNIESIQNISSENIIQYGGELEKTLTLSLTTSSIEELDIAINVINRQIDSIKLDIEEINLNGSNELSIEQKKEIIKKKKEIIKFENIVSMYEMRKLELSKEATK